jgi:hypothetical protein
VVHPLDDLPERIYDKRIVVCDQDFRHARQGKISFLIPARIIWPFNPAVKAGDLFPPGRRFFNVSKRPGSWPRSRPPKRLRMRRPSPRDRFILLDDLAESRAEEIEPGPAAASPCRAVPGHRGHGDR